jgi:hypothetical protein
MTDQQPVRRGAPRVGRRFDQTQLRASKFGYRVHRDYAAHFFKWGFATRLIGPSDLVLDVGCGQDIPLMQVLSMGGRYVPEVYTGVDLNKIDRHTTPWATVLDRFNYVDRWGELPNGHWTVGVSIEVLEHMSSADGRTMLEGLRCNLRHDGRLILSTPVFNGKAAKNHVHEYTVHELLNLFLSTGWAVEQRYGTFASYRDLKANATAPHLEVLEGIRKFYSDEVAACFLAPLYPDISRNNVWVLRPSE